MSQLNTFANTSDTKTIIRFVKEIERHPCLYDRSSPFYIDREMKRKTWIQIAKKANSTVADCKDKWTKIRTAYIRTLRPSYNDGIRTFGRPYYLASHLKFILPMKKNGEMYAAPFHPSISEKKSQPEEINEMNTNDEDEQSDESDNDSSPDTNPQHQVFLDEDKNSFDDDEDIIGYSNLMIDRREMTNERNKAKDISISITKKVNKRKVKEATNANEDDTDRIDKRKSTGLYENLECNPRKMFIFSLLPDIEDLNEQQMRYFRREVIKLIESVFDESQSLHQK